MKKLMIAAAIVCAAAFAQASAFNWTTTSMGKIYKAGSSTDLWSGTAYLFASDTGAGTSAYKVLQSAILDDGVAAHMDQVVATATIANGQVSPTTGQGFSFGNDADANKFFMVLVDGDKVFVSTSVNGAGQEGRTTTVSPSGSGSKNAAVNWEKGATFSKAGWYNTVPEPTSGLLLLLGVAGLALRRRRA